MVKLIRQGIQLRNINEIKNLLISQKNSFLNSPDRLDLHSIKARSLSKILIYHIVLLSVKRFSSTYILHEFLHVAPNTTTYLHRHLV